MSKARRKFTDEFKREAVKLCKQPGAVVTQVAGNLGVDQSVLRRWVQQERGGVLEMSPAKPLRSEMATELERVQRELRRVTMERDILKKALGYFAKDPQ
jgi:transposase